MTVKTFNILNYVGSDHINVLSEDRSQLVCQCPVCGGGRMTIDKRNGAYQCWSGGCECRDIREAIAPWSERNQQQQNPRVVNPKVKVKPKAPNPAPLPDIDQIALAALPELPIDIPQRQERLDQERGKVNEIVYRYSQTQEVIRTEWADSQKAKGYSKIVIPYHVDGKSSVKRGKNKLAWPLYKEPEALQHGSGKWIILVEGESCVEVCRWLQLVSVTFQGADWSGETIHQKLIELKAAGIAGIVCLPDNDQAGQQKSEKVAVAAAKTGMPLVTIAPLDLWEDMPHAGDIADWVAWGQEQGMGQDDFVRRLEEIFKETATRGQEQNHPDTNEDVKVPDFADDAADVIELFSQTAFEALYTYWPWICVNNVLYCWSESQTYYKESPDVVERRRIAEFCNTYPVPHKTPSGDTYYRYDHATAEWVERVLKWVKIRLAIRPELANPPGLNCTNGVLEINWNGNVPSWQLVDHDPKVHYYTYEPQATFDLSADPTDCDRLLAALDKPQQEVFLRTIAASLDLATVRQHKGRLVRAVLAKGYGNNGKDSLREIVSMMYGHRGMTGATLTDFAQYDSGRKFPLASLIRSRVNWASENANTAKLDTIQSLKAFVTGDPIDSERKGKDEQSFNPIGVAFFNINDPPSVQASLEAITSRYAVLSFNKTFKIGADPSKGEIEADPRFKYDPNFLRSDVLPAFLNRVLGALVDLMTYGIDYSCTVKAMEDIEAQNSHLFQFCQDVGLQYDPAAKLTAGEIWQRLEQWYIDNGTLTYEETAAGKQKALWIDQARKGDANVRGANQVIARFQSLFPKTTRVTITNGPDKNRMALLGIGFKTPDNPGNPDTPKNAAEVSQLPYQVSQSVSQLETPKPLLDKGCSESGKAGKPVSIVSEKTEIEVTQTQQSENSDVDKAVSVDTPEKLPYLPYHPDTASDTGLPTALSTGLPANQTGLPLPHRDDAIAPQPTPKLQQATLNLVAKLESPNPEESVEVWHGGEWKSATLLQCPNNHDDPQQRITCWKVRLGTGHILFVWQGSKLRFPGGET